MITEKIDYGIAIKKLNEWTRLYDEGHPEVSDKEWDDLYFEVEDFEKRTGIVFATSPTQHIDYQVVDKLTKVTHDHPMLSLDKVKDNISAIENFIDGKEYIAMSKMDGLTCSLTYDELGNLIKAETRGNGEVGEDILHNALTIESIPKHIDVSQETVIDGEVICTYQDFKEFEGNYANPRNFASGSIRLLDAKECKKRHLSFVAWDCIRGMDQVESLSKKLDRIRLLGFLIVPYITSTEKKDINKSIIHLKSTSSTNSYPIDGVVFKWNNCEVYAAAGLTGHHPKGALAYKFYDDEYETKLQDITYDVSRRGILTPVAVFDEIDFGDSVVNRASLHNLSIMHETLGQHPKRGQVIYVAKMNMIIPQVVRSEPSDDESDDEIRPPHVCPICGKEIKIQHDGMADILYCVNPSCPRKLINQIDFAISKKALDIKGLSKATIEKLMDLGWINSLADIFELRQHREEWIQQPSFGAKSVDKILTSIEEGCNTTLEKVIAACMIPNIGTTASKDLAMYFKTWNNFIEAAEGDFDFTTLANFGEVADYDIKHTDYSEMKEIVRKYFSIAEISKAAAIRNGVVGKIFVITGKLSIPRDEFKKRLEDAGAKVTSSVSGKTNYLIANEPEDTAKYKKALSLSVPILTENDVELMLQS